MEKKIGNLEYRVDKLDARNTLKYGRRIAAIMGDAIPLLMQSLEIAEKVKGLDKDSPEYRALTNDGNGMALAAIMNIAKTGGEEVDRLIEELSAQAQVNWKGRYMQVNIDTPETYNDDVKQLLEIVMLVLQVNYKSFFSGL